MEGEGWRSAVVAVEWWGRERGERERERGGGERRQREEGGVGFCFGYCGLWVLKVLGVRGGCGFGAWVGEGRYMGVWVCLCVCVCGSGGRRNGRGGREEGAVSQEGFACVWEFVPRFLLVCGRRREGSGRGGVRFGGGSISRCLVFFGVSGLLS